MRFQLRYFIGLAVSFLFVFCSGYGTGNYARAQTGPKTIPVFPANADQTAVDRAIAGADADSAADNVSCGLTGTRMSPMACTVQELVDLAAPGDTVMFMPAPSGDDPNVYDDVGEILVTKNGDDSATAAPAVETITIRGMGSGDDMITFTGKVMFNVKTSNIVIRGFKFKDTEPPDTATMRATFDATAGEADKTVEYGLSGKTIAAYLAEVDEDWTAGEALTPANIIANQGISFAGESTSAFDIEKVREVFWSDQLYVTIVPGATGAGELARLNNGGQIQQNSSNNRLIIGQALPVFTALNAMGTVWIDSASTQSCDAGGDLTNVQVRNNVFENTYLTGVKAGNHSYSGMSIIRGQTPDIAGNDCSAQVEIIGNTFMNVGGNGPFLRRSETVFFTDADGNRIADAGNHEAAISFSKVTSTGTGAAVSSKITHNTISGGTYDAIILENTPANAKIEISRNNIADSILNGIHILGPMGTASNLVVPTADITVEGNRIWGGSSNRFLTKVFWGNFERTPNLIFAGYHEGAEPRNGDGISSPPNAGRNFNQSVIQSCKGYVHHDTRWQRSSTTRHVRRNIMPEIWKSNVPTFAFLDIGAPRAFSDEEGEDQFREIRSSVASNPLQGSAAATTLANDDLIRYRADGCYDLGRIRVVNQKGVTMNNNDLGYWTDASGVSPTLSPDNGVVMMGTGVVPESFEGNNIGFYKNFAILSEARFSAAKNYLGAENWRVSSAITGADNNGGEPFETSDEREIGPDPAVAVPDEEAPELVTGGDDAPAVDGASLTLTFDDTLDAMSRPAPSAFRVMAGASTILNVESVSISGMTVTLTLEAAAREGETITVAYTKPASNAIMDDAGNALESFTATAVTNNSTGGAMPGTTMPPAAIPSGDDGGCTLASAGSGVDMGALVLLLGAVFAFGLGRKAKAE